MDSLLKYLQQNFSSDTSLWEKLLQAELKLEDVSSKTSRKTLEGVWPTLSLDAPVTHLLPVAESWKKAAQTYVQIPPDIATLVQDDLDHGVRLFFFQKNYLKQKQWGEIEATLNAFAKLEELQVFLLGDGWVTTKSSNFKVIQEDELISGRKAHAPGGNNVQELALLTVELIAKLASPADTLYLGIFLDPQLFKNISKIRAAKLLAQKVLLESGVKKEIRLVGLTSYRNWTLYERYSNILRNVSSVTSGYLGGADYVQSSGYQTLLELEAGTFDASHAERSRRVARNTSHILSLESMLGVVEDPAFGSFHLENLTESYAARAWAMMQKIHHLTPQQVNDFFHKETVLIRTEREHRIETRRHVVAGTNDFPDVKEVLNLEDIPVPKFYRTSLAFENLRLRMEKVKKKPDVYLGIFGDYAALNSRINFVKNYFEILGLQVNDPAQAQTDFEVFKKEVSIRNEKIVVLCLSDNDHPLLHAININAREKFIAGKFEKIGFQNLFAGQNVYQVLEGIVERWSRT